MFPLALGNTSTVTDAAGLLMIFEEERIRRDIHAGVVDKARTSSSEHGGQNHPFGGHQRPRPHRDNDGIRLDDAAVDLNTPHGRSIRTSGQCR